MKYKKYNVCEIDDLRKACENKFLYDVYNLCVLDDWRHLRSRPYKEEEKTKCVEELVRTYMIAGILAEDLYKQEQQYYDLCKMRNNAYSIMHMDK